MQSGKGKLRKLVQSTTTSSTKSVLVIYTDQRLLSHGKQRFYDTRNSVLPYVIAVKNVAINPHNFIPKRQKAIVYSDDVAMYYSKKSSIDSIWKSLKLWED